MGVGVSGKNHMWLALNVFMYASLGVHVHDFTYACVIVDGRACIRS